MRSQPRRILLIDDDPVDRELVRYQLLDIGETVEYESADSGCKGIELIRKQFEDALSRLGVQPIEAHGTEFDPHQHEAVEMAESSEHPDNHVIDELQRGYRLRGRMLRPAMVRVAKNR